ncbi:MAG: 50S ribosomal protein L29 [Candidatus Diapherotrites archaeon]|nr:50S ribosomal protein L29 [Candidatus Diapherotrites archaeon]
MKKIAEIRELNVAEIKEKAAGLRKDLAKEKAVIASGTRPENPGKIRSIRRDIARMLTILKEKETEKEKTGGKVKEVEK